MALARKSTAVDIYKDWFAITANPFRSAEIYNPDSPGTYVREVYGDQLAEVHEKFFVGPLDRDKPQVIGAIWSSHAGDSEGRGFGKSMLMCEETKLTNRDFGAATLRAFDVVDSDIAAYPYLAGYCTFSENLGIKSFPAALLEAVAFALRCDHGKWNVHQELRDRIIAQYGAEPPYESEAVERVLLNKLASYRNLSIQYSSRQVAGFIDALCHSETKAVADYIREKIGPRVRAAQGFHFVHIFNAFASLAGIKHVVYFVDQIENFAKFARHQERDVRILRESMCQTSPTAEMASFVFQMHINAQRVLEPIWQTEHLPSIDYAQPLNQTRIVDLRGLSSKEHACQVTARLLEGKRPQGVKPPTPLHPFDPDVLELVRQACDGNPRKFLELLDTILVQARSDKMKTIDLTYVGPLVDEVARQYRVAEEVEEDDDDLRNPIR
jgi:hypothetical protein